jgi:recombination protein RecR
MDPENRVLIIRKMNRPVENLRDDSSLFSTLAEMNFSSKLIENAVHEIAKLPGIGQKTALRLALHLLRRDEEEVAQLSESLVRLRREVQFCQKCHNISDAQLCGICANPNRDESVLCVVQDTRDVMAIENTSQYRGGYHVLGGLISPMDGIGPHDLNVESLIQRCEEAELTEVILALSATTEGDTTNFYLFKKLKESGVRITTLARGVSVGDDLEYADEITLGRSLQHRIPYENSLNQA